MIAHSAPLLHTIQGAGHPVLLVPGFCEDQSVWNHLIPFLPTGYQYIRLDLGGLGKNQKALPEPCTLDNLALQIADLLDFLDIPEAIWMGHSLGGYVGLAFARIFPERLSGLALINSSSLADAPQKKRSRKHSIRFVEEKGIEKYAHTFVKKLIFSGNHQRLDTEIKELIAMVAQTSLRAFRALSQAMMEREAQSQVISQANWPVIFLHGAHDQAIPINEDFLNQANLAPEIEFYIIPKTGHILMLESPEICGNYLGPFLEKCIREKKHGKK